MKQLIQKLCSLGHNAMELVLQPIHYSNKEGENQVTYAFSNRKKQGKTILNGEIVESSSVSVFTPGQQPAVAKVIVTNWQNDMDADHYQMLLDTHGATWIGILDDDQNCVVMTQEEATACLTSEQAKPLPTTTSEQVVAS